MGKPMNGLHVWVGEAVKGGVWGEVGSGWACRECGRSARLDTSVCDCTIGYSAVCRRGSTRSSENALMSLCCVRTRVCGRPVSVNENLCRLSVRVDVCESVRECAGSVQESVLVCRKSAGSLQESAREC